MTSIPDWQIEQLADQSLLITPYLSSQLNPASYDVRLGDLILTEIRCSESSIAPQEKWSQWDLNAKPYYMDPGEFLLAYTKEYFTIPSYLEAQFQLKSSRGREGFEHVMSGYVDPGFQGQLTLELVNVNRWHSLKLEKDMLIGQVRFSSLFAPPRKDYSKTGHYQLDEGVKPSKVDIFGNTLIKK